MQVIGYARVSSKDQDLGIQIQEIKKYCEYRSLDLVRTYTDKASGKDTNREGFQDMMKVLEKNTFGVNAVIVYKLDRMGRSIKNLIDILDEFGRLKIQLICVADNIDTSTPQGMLFFHMVSSFAEYERKLIQERTEAGIKEALKNGVRFGRPRKKVDMEAVRADIAMGIPKSKVCKKYGIGRTLLYSKLGSE